MKTQKEIDILHKAEWFEDTPQLVEDLSGMDLPSYARHLHKMHVYQKALIAEVRKLRRQLKAKL